MGPTKAHESAGLPALAVTGVGTMRNARLLFDLLLLTILVGCQGNCGSSAHVVTPVVVNRPAFYSGDTLGRKNVVARCAKGEQMIGGGYRLPLWLPVLNRDHLNCRQIPTGPGEPGYEECFTPNSGPDWNDRATICDKEDWPLIVEASYPSSAGSPTEPDSWTVTVFNPDPAPGCFRDGELVQVDCYCMTNPRLRLGMKIVRGPSDPHPVYLTPAYALANTNAECAGGVVTAGGFKLDVYESDYDWRRGGSLENVVWGSYPKFDPVTMHATGWTTQYNTSSLIIPYGENARPLNATLSTYALCSMPRVLYAANVGATNAPSPPVTIPSPLVAGPVKTADLILGSTAWGPRNGWAVCDEGYFSSGGGYLVTYAPLDQDAPYLWLARGPTSTNTAEALVNGQFRPFAGHTLVTVAGHNTERSKWSTQEKETVYAVQLRDLPRNLEVEILNPPDRMTIGESGDMPGYSDSFDFRGRAFDHDGSPIRPEDLRWEIAGGTTGVGANFPGRVKLDSGTFDSYMYMMRYRVALTATSKEGDTETAAIYLFLQPRIL